MANCRTILSACSRHLASSFRHQNTQLNNHRWISGATTVLHQNTSTASDSDTAKTTTENSETPSPEDSNATEISAESKEIEQLKKDLVDLKDKYQRTLADRENVRVRLEKQVVDAKLYGIQGFCKDLLEVSDVFRKALESVQKSDVAAGSEQLRSLHDGVSMTETQLLSVYRRHGLASIDLESGNKFDPSSQEAMFEVPSAEETQVPGTVAHVLRKGWKLHDRCIRSAQVGVYKQ